jgi:predicted RNase H-like nuclease
VLAGVVPTSRGWLTASAKLQGTTLSPEGAQIFGSILEVIDFKPAYQIIAMFCPIGLLDDPTVGGRTCDREARRLLGWPRSGAVVSPPVRAALGARSYEEAAVANGGHLSIVTWQRMKRLAELDANVAPYWQRTVFEVHPELTFFQLNEDMPVRYSKHSAAGWEERHALLQARLPGLERVLQPVGQGISKPQLIDAAACLWAARRIAARGVNRLPEDPEWDSMGLRMELIR